MNSIHVQVLTLGGSFSGNLTADKGGEVYDGTAWRQTDIPAGPILSDDQGGNFRTDNYPFLFYWTENSGADSKLLTSQRLPCGHAPQHVSYVLVRLDRH